MKGIYIAGPMSGIPDNNFPSFNAAEKYLDSMGYNLIGNPAKWEADRENEFVPAGVDSPLLRNLLGSDLRWIGEHAGAVFMLNGWENSKGARAEHALAVALGINIYYQKGL